MFNVLQVDVTQLPQESLLFGARMYKHFNIRLNVSLYAILFPSFSGHRLDNNLIRKVTALSSVECNLECLREQCCKSTNYKEFLSCDTRDNCELSHAGASEKPEDLVKEDAYLHYEMLRPDRVSKMSLIDRYTDNESEGVDRMDT